METPSTAQFLDVVRGQFPTSGPQLSSTTLFRELEEWSSLQALVLITVLDETYGQALREEEMKKAQSLGDLHQILVEKMQSNA